MRISLFGGGSDIPWFYEKNGGGATLSLAINKYVTLLGDENFDNQTFHLKYSTNEKVYEREAIHHPIIREVAELFQLQPIDLAIHSDFPSGTGMGSSSSFTCAMIQFASEVSGKTLPKSELAELACKVEIELLGEPIGKQDQYASAYGGLNLIEFSTLDTKVKALPLTKELTNHITGSLKLVYLGLPSRSASKHLIAAKLAANTNKKVEDSLVELRNFAYEAFSSIPSDPEVIGRLLGEAWNLKKASHPEASNEAIEELVQLGISNGASGGKLLGAGGSGFVVFWVTDDQRAKFYNAMQAANLRVVEFEIDTIGTRVERIN